MAEPKVRFKQNNGTSFPAWENNTIGHYLQIRDEKQIPSESAPLMAFIAYQGVADKGDRYDRSFLVKSDDKKYKRTEFNDFIYSSNNLDVGSIGLNKYGSAVISVVYEIFKCKENCIPDCINALLQMPQSIAKMLKYRQGALYGQYKIPAEDFLSIRIDMPCLEEQQRIADFLSSVDEVITASEEEVANLETQKKAVMKKIFSQEVRFKKADGSDFPEWGKCKAVDCCKVFCDGDWIESKDQSESGIRLVQTGNVGNGVFVEKEARKRFISAETFDRLHCTEIFAGDILISRLPDPAGRACIVPASSERMVTAVDCTIVRPDDNRLTTEYLVQFYQSSVHFKYVNNMLAGGTRQRVSRGNLEEEEVLLPSLEEQRLIADFLSDFDEAIAAAKKELELWKELKKGLLQQMFV